MKTSNNWSGIPLFSLLRESLTVALAFAMATFLFAAIGVQAQKLSGKSACPAFCDSSATREVKHARADRGFGDEYESKAK